MLCRYKAILEKRQKFSPGIRICMCMVRGTECTGIPARVEHIYMPGIKAFLVSEYQ